MHRVRHATVIALLVVAVAVAGIAWWAAQRAAALPDRIEWCDRTWERSRVPSSARLPGDREWHEVKKANGHAMLVPSEGTGATACPADIPGDVFVRDGGRYHRHTILGGI